MTVGYFAAGKVGLMMAFLNPSVSPVWPPTGIAIAMLLLLGRRVWPAVFVGAFLVNVTTAGGVWTSLGIATGNTLEGLVGAALVARISGGERAFDSIYGTLSFAFLAGIVSPVVSATIGVFSLWLGGLVASSAILHTWFTWWMGDMVGAITLTPLIIQWSRRWKWRWDALRLLEFVSVLALTVFIGAFVFIDHNIFPWITLSKPMPYLTLPPLLWVTIRFGPRETVTVMFLLSCIAILGSLSAMGPFADLGPNASLLYLQSFVGIVTVVALTLAAAMHERRVAEESLEEQVGQRTMELRRAREQDRLNLQRLRATVTHLPMGALLLDELGNILELNHEYCQLICGGMPLQEAKGMNQDQLAAQFARSVVDAHLYRSNVLHALEKGEALLQQEMHLTDGRVLLRDFIPIYDHGMFCGQLFLYRDVTQERRVDRAKSEFMSLASHQLRTPLTAIRWGINRLRKLSEQEAAQRDHVLHEVQSAAVRMAGTIDMMLKISRMEAQQAQLDMQDCDVCALLHERVKLFSEQMEAKKQICTLECPERVILRTDAAYLTEIVDNLVQNAVKYTPEGGRITLRIATQERTLTVQVEDTGYGIPVHQQKNVFQKFFRADNIIDKDTEGTGLGLYLVSLIIHVLHGTIDVYSEEGKGTMFTLTLPLKA